MRMIAIACFAVLLAISLFGAFGGAVYYKNRRSPIFYDIHYPVGTAKYQGSTYALKYVLYKDGTEKIADEETNLMIRFQQSGEAAKAVSQRFFWPLLGSIVGVVLSIGGLLMIWIPLTKKDEGEETAEV